MHVIVLRAFKDEIALHTISVLKISWLRLEDLLRRLMMSRLELNVLILEPVGNDKVFST